MSVVIIGGNECMERKYRDLCQAHGCEAKVFCQYQGGLAERIGSPNLLILFTHTVPHKMVKCALQAVDENTTVVRCHSSSVSSLRQILAENA